MKKWSVWACAAVLATGLTGCSGGSAPTGPVEPTSDGRPPDFEDMMKGMGDQMKKATASPGSLSKGSAAGPSSSSGAGTEK